jgi:hypothetical protein
MRYMLLIYDREVDWEALNEKDKGASADSAVDPIS